MTAKSNKNYTVFTHSVFLYPFFALKDNFRHFQLLSYDSTLNASLKTSPSDFIGEGF